MGGVIYVDDSTASDYSHLLVALVMKGRKGKKQHSIQQTEAIVFFVVMCKSRGGREAAIPLFGGRAAKPPPVSFPVTTPALKELHVVASTRQLHHAGLDSFTTFRQLRNYRKMSDLADAPVDADVSMQDAPDLNAAIPTEEEIEKKFPNRPINTKETLPFHMLYTKLFKPLQNNNKTHVGLRGDKKLKPPNEQRRNIIEQFIARWRSEVGPDIFPAFRLILCDKDKDRNVYHLKENRIAGLLIKVVKINKDSDDGKALIDWCKPGQESAGNFALRCYGMLFPASLLSL